MKRILLETTDDFVRNKGEDAVCFSEIAMLQSLGEVEVTRVAVNPELASRKYGVKSVYFGPHPLKLLRNSPKILRTFLRADLYVFGGGLALRDVTTYLSVPFRLSKMVLAKLLGKPVMTFGLGVFIETRFAKTLVRWVFNRLDAIVVRDESSKKKLLSAGVKRPICLTADSALTLTPASPSRAQEILNMEEIPASNRGLVAIAMFGQAFRSKRGLRTHKYLFENDVWQPGAREKAELYVDIMARIADYVIEELGADVLFFAQEGFPDGTGEDDLITGRAIDRMKSQQRVFRVRGDYLPREVLALYGACEMTISARFHAVIFSLAMNTPVVGISYEEKTGDLLTRVGSAYHVNIEHLEYNLLRQNVDYVWKNRDLVRSDTKPKVERLKEEVFTTLDHARALLGIPVSVTEDVTETGSGVERKKVCSK